MDRLPLSRIATVACACAALAACGPDATPPAASPPAPLPEFVQEQPAPGMLWTPGCWHWDGEGYVWLPGHWETPPK